MVNLIDGLGSRELLLAAGALLGVMLYNAYFRHQSLEYVQTAPDRAAAASA